VGKLPICSPAGQLARPRFEEYLVSERGVHGGNDDEQRKTAYPKCSISRYLGGSHKHATRDNSRARWRAPWAKRKGGAIRTNNRAEVRDSETRLTMTKDLLTIVLESTGRESEPMARLWETFGGVRKWDHFVQTGEQGYCGTSAAPTLAEKRLGEGLLGVKGTFS